MKWCRKKKNPEKIWTGQDETWEETGLSAMTHRERQAAKQTDSAWSSPHLSVNDSTVISVGVMNIIISLLSREEYIHRKWSMNFTLIF